MAKMIDMLPEKYGEQLTWQAFSKNLPKNYVVYNTRTVKGDEYDFCVMVENVGLYIVEVKGWLPSNVISVNNPDTILIEGYSNPLGSPLKQARGYRFKLVELLNQELGMDPLVMSMVCYPRISRNEYFNLGLNTVSHESETIFEEELNDPLKLVSKLMQRYDLDKPKKHDVLDHRKFILMEYSSLYTL